MRRREVAVVRRLSGLSGPRVAPTLGGHLGRCAALAVRWPTTHRCASHGDGRSARRSRPLSAAALGSPRDTRGATGRRDHGGCHARGSGAVHGSLEATCLERPVGAAATATRTSCCVGPMATRASLTSPTQSAAWWAKLSKTRSPRKLALPTSPRDFTAMSHCRKQNTEGAHVRHAYGGGVQRAGPLILFPATAGQRATCG